jgi:formylglycine-generating enzyme required for sulfatase activity
MGIQSKLSGKPRHRAILILLLILSLAAFSCGGEGEIEVTYTTAALPMQAPADQPTSTPEPTSAPAEGQTVQPVQRPLDGITMVHIPAGEFVMGSDASAFAPEKPEHLVSLDEYWIDRTEVTNAQFRGCVEAGVCSEPKPWSDPNLNSDAQPALVVWESADTYCQWVGGRLPSEAEWEKAARGMDGRQWPWGNEFIADNANLSSDADGYGFTAPVGSFPSGASPYGLLDMAGNAAEWVADWYDAGYYAQSPAANPTGPASGETKVIRGSISNAGGGPEKCRCTARYPQDPVRWEFGFRCAMSAAPTGATAPPSEQPASGSESGAPTPPADASAQPTEPPGPAGPTGSPPEITDLDSVDSYRLTMTSTAQSGDSAELTTVVTEEWVREPPARRLTLTPGTDRPTFEYVVIGDSAWMKLGESWTTIPQSEVQDYNENLSPFLQPEPDMKFVGEETVNGFHTRHYVRDVEVPMETLHHEIWVVDQPDMPPVAVRMVYQLEVTSGQMQMVTTGQVDVTEINTPITIEPPQ